MEKIQREQVCVTATIASGQATSGVIPLYGLAGGRFNTPAAMTSSSVTFEASMDGDTFAPVYNADGDLATVTIATNAAQSHPLPDMFGAKSFKIVAAGNEGAARTIQVGLSG